MTTETTKRCAVCRLDKPLRDFRKHARKQHGVDSTCRDCVSSLRMPKKRRREIRDDEPFCTQPYPNCLM